MKTIEEIKSMDVHIEFSKDGRFYFYFNNEELEDGVEIPLDKLKVIARTLSRIAVEMWCCIDKTSLEEEKNK